MKLVAFKTATLALALLIVFALGSCTGQTVQDTVEPLPIITRPPETTKTPEPEIPPHENIWSALPVYTAYRTPDKEDNSIGYTAYPCTVEGCEEIRDNWIRPVLIALDFESEMSFEEYLEQVDRVSPFIKRDTLYSEGEVTGGVYRAIGQKDEQVFILSELPLDELAVFTVSFDAYFGISSHPGKDTFFGFGRSGAEASSVYYFQLREKDGKLIYLNNFTEMDLQTNGLLSYEFQREKWYHFDLEIHMEQGWVSIRVGEWNEDRTELISSKDLGTCDKLQKINADNLEFLVFRISASNGLSQMDNFFVTLPEK